MEEHIENHVDFISEKNTPPTEKPLPLKPKKKERNSNLELYRILAMFWIVAHHYVVNSGLYSSTAIFSNVFSINSIFLLLFGAWGKTGINCFVLITGYFMCKSNITLKKFLKLFLEFYFYKIIIASIFWITGYSSFSLTELIKVLIPIRTIGVGFIGNFFVFFLTIPFLNILIKNASEKQHILLILFSLGVYCFFATIPTFKVTMNYFSWFIVLYFISSYIRMYPRKIFDKTTLWLILSLVSIALSIASIFVCSWLYTKGYLRPYSFVEDCNTLLALTNGITTFLLFKNIKMKPSKFINTVAATMFGVLCIHANSDSMRQFLWGDLFNNAGAYTSNYLPLHAILTVLIVFVACILIDLFRIYAIEKPFFKLYDRLDGKIANKYTKLENNLCDKYNVKR